MMVIVLIKRKQKYTHTFLNIFFLILRHILQTPLEALQNVAAAYIMKVAVDKIQDRLRNRNNSADGDDLEHDLLPDDAYDVSYHADGEYSDGD